MAKKAKKKMAVKKKIPAPRRRALSPDTIRLWWTGFGAVLMVTLLMDFAVHPHAEFGLEGTLFFHAWFGFAACAAIVVLSKWLGALLKRPEDYYGE